MSADKQSPGWIRQAGAGVQLAASIAGLTGLGYWIDVHYGTKPWGLIVGLVLGFVGGFYNLVKESLQAVRDARDEDASNKSNTRNSDGA
jgi:F0F1-type ATP synthase assembly protein I